MVDTPAPKSKPKHICLPMYVGMLRKQTHAGTAIGLAAMLEQLVSVILVRNMPHLSNRLEPRLFEGYGPLGSFSAKIDVAFALGFITADESRTLHAIRKIRNTFAHSFDALIDFEHKDLEDAIAKLPGAKHEGSNNHHRFQKVALACCELLVKHISCSTANDPEKSAAKRKTSKKNSLDRILVAYPAFRMVSIQMHNPRLDHLRRDFNLRWFCRPVVCLFHFNHCYVKCIIANKYPLTLYS